MKAPDDVEAFAALMFRLAGNFRQEATKEWSKGMWEDLADLPIEGVRRACDTARKTLRFMPTVAELRELAGADTAAIRAARAWAAVVEGIRKHGYTGGLDARGDNGLTHAVVRAMGGWSMLCRTDSEELHSFKAKQFAELYEAMGASLCTYHESKPLLGESGNARVLSIGGLDERRALPAVEAKALVRG